MLAKQFSIEINIRHGTGGFKADEVTPARLRLADVQVAPVPPRTAIITLTLLRFLPTPIVRNGQSQPIMVVEIIFLGAGNVADFVMPARIEQRNLPGKTGKE